MYARNDSMKRITAVSININPQRAVKYRSGFPIFRIPPHQYSVDFQFLQPFQHPKTSLPHHITIQPRHRPDLLQNLEVARPTIFTPASFIYIKMPPKPHGPPHGPPHAPPHPKPHPGPPHPHAPGPRPHPGPHHPRRHGHP